jgi:hypothetical protein
MRRLQAKLDALEGMSVIEIRSEWCRTFSEPPPKLPPPLLRRLLAQKLQERRYGGLSAMVRRELERVAAGEAPKNVRLFRKRLIKPGTRLRREWQRRLIEVIVADEGFYWEDRHYRSLSEIARQVTGVRWSGPRFFGLDAHA